MYLRIVATLPNSYNMACHAPSLVHWHKEVDINSCFIPKGDAPSALQTLRKHSNGMNDQFYGTGRISEHYVRGEERIILSRNQDDEGKEGRDQV